MNTPNIAPKKSSHIGAGLMAGAILGLAAGLFLQSRKGKQLAKDAQKRATKLQAQVLKKLGSVEGVTKERYEDVVDHILDYYTKTRDIAKTELPEVKKFLMGRWKSIREQIKKTE